MPPEGILREHTYALLLVKILIWFIREIMMGLKSREELNAAIRSDFERTNGKGSYSFLRGIRALIFETSFKYMYWVRKTRFHYLQHNKVRFLLCLIIHKHYSIKYGCEISYKTELGNSIVITHPFGIVVFARKIGNNVWFHSGCLIGQAHNGKGDIPTIGSNVSFGAGCKVIGDISIGDNVIIGANAVVLRDVPHNCKVAGNPAAIIGRCNGIWD